MSELSGQDIKFLKGVGPKKAMLINSELHISNLEEMLYYVPYKYSDRTKFYKINELKPNLPNIQLIGTIEQKELIGEGKKKRLNAKLVDESGTLELTWFSGAKWIKDSLKDSVKYVVYGKPSFYNGIFSIVHPDIDKFEDFAKKKMQGLQAHYNTTEKMKKGYLNSKAILNIQSSILESINGKIPETLPAYLLNKLNLLNLHESLVNIHFPNNKEDLERAKLRLKFEELFYIQLNLLRMKSKRKLNFKGLVFDKIGTYFNDFYNNNLPFELTGAQKRVLKEVRLDTRTGKQMNRLIQGDVGSGKTMVGLMCILMALDNGFQGCMMAPTEILANQHFESITEYVKGLGIKVALLTGSTKKSERKLLHEQLLSGEIHILIGTHALIEDVVQFKSLGMVIIDEQHKFGVAQRAKLWKKNNVIPHVLVMTATPIPRTLAMTLYGDLDVSVIDELPPGRKPILTYHQFENKRPRLYEFVKKQIDMGRQVYIVYPLIKENEKMDYKNLESGYENLIKEFPIEKYGISIVHGKMKADEKDKEMVRFANGETQIMVATTVIEVGVNVPNATTMIIESSERFGLSQLHQLRGRVGRGGEQSYCILMSNYKISQNARSKLETMVKSNDGFEIAEADLKLRGPGDIEGTQQSGIAVDLKIANLARDGILLQKARDIASKIIEDDPLVEKEENFILNKQLKRIFKTRINWSFIS